jgi:hypothetical protein
MRFQLKFRVTATVTLATAAFCIGLIPAHGQGGRHNWNTGRSEGWDTTTYSRQGAYVVKTRLESSKSLADPAHEFSTHKEVYYWTAIPDKAPETYAMGDADKTGTDQELFSPGNHFTYKFLAVKNELGVSNREYCRVSVTDEPYEKVVLHAHYTLDAENTLVSGKKNEVVTTSGQSKSTHSEYDAATKVWKDVGAFADPTKCDDPKFPFRLM